MARSQNRQFAIGGRVRPPGVSIASINRSLTDDDRKRAAARRRIEVLAERQELLRRLDGDW